MSIRPHKIFRINPMRVQANQHKEIYQKKKKKIVLKYSKRNLHKNIESLSKSLMVFRIQKTLLID